MSHQVSVYPVDDAGIDISHLEQRWNLGFLAPPSTQIGENRKVKADRRAAYKPTPAQLAEQLIRSRQESINSQQGRVPLPVQISDV